MTSHDPDDERWMQQALALAVKGRGAVEPNPMVGAVVVGADGRLVGVGWHERYGGPHAEVHALTAAGGEARGGTLYVTLEPCCHWGKTPPCTEAVLRSGVRRVVAAMADPFPQVAAGGLTVLRNAGRDVTVGVGEAHARRLNAPYLKLVQGGRPWVIAKWAMTLDGKIATRTGNSQWISGPESRQRVHELRGRVDAIVVGRGTILADNPLLTARPPGPRVAARIVLTRSGDLPERCQVRQTARDFPTLVVTAAGNEGRLAGWATDGAEVIGLPSREGGLSLAVLLEELGHRRMTNVLVEGGAGVLGAFRDAHAIDEAWVFVAPMLLGGQAALTPVGGYGVDVIRDAVRPEHSSVERLGDDTLIVSRFSTS